MMQKWKCFEDDVCLNTVIIIIIIIIIIFIIFIIIDFMVNGYRLHV